MRIISQVTVKILQDNESTQLGARDIMSVPTVESKVAPECIHSSLTQGGHRWVLTVWILASRMEVLCMFMEGRNGIQNNYMKCLLEGNNKRPLAISTFHCARDPFQLIPAGAQKLEKINFIIHCFNSPFVWEDWHWCSMGEKWIALPSLCNYLLFFLPSNERQDLLWQGRC